MGVETGLNGPHQHPAPSLVGIAAARSRAALSQRPNSPGAFSGSVGIPMARHRARPQRRNMRLHSRTLYSL